MGVEHNELSGKAAGGEATRLAAVHSLQLLDTPPEERFDRVVRLAQLHFGASGAYFSLVDAERAWFKSARGLDVGAVARAGSFCERCLDGEPLVLSDARSDSRFDRNPLVVDGPRVRFYAGRAVRSASGLVVGALAVIDREPRTLNDDGLAALSDLAEVIERELALTGSPVEANPLLTFAEAARQIEAGNFGDCGLLDLADRTDVVGQLARVFRSMATAVESRETNLRETTFETVQRLVVAAEYKDDDTAAHVRRMSRYTELLARKVGLGRDEVDLLRMASPLHDVGKMGVPDSVLLKPARLDDGEWATMRGHTSLGAAILSGSRSELLRAGEVIALSHHERWDGSGYPLGLSGENIPLWGRICAVADVYDALTSRRPYKPAYTPDEALRMMSLERGRHFDPKLFDIFAESHTEVLNIRDGETAAAAD